MAKPIDQSTDKYKNSISQINYERGVNAVNTNPATKAIAQKDLFVKNTVAGKNKLVKNLSKVPLNEWQNAAKGSFDKLETKVVSAVDTGKYPANIVLEAGKAAHNIVQDMPKGTYAQSYDRYLAAQNAVKNKYK